MERILPTERGVAGPLEKLQVLTDNTLSVLGMEEFLEQLLSRVCDILRADTSAVLLLDEGTGQLVATAAHGIEEEVRQGVRIPVGRGFAGSIAAQREPVLLDRVDSTTVANPILWEKGIRVMLGVPLLAGPRLLGVLHVGRLQDLPFTPSEAQLLQVVADRVSGATQALQLAAEKSAASLLEKSLLPGRMPPLPGLEFATRYMTPEDRTVGGDWFDGFVSPSGQLWIVVGDIAGRGLPAAVIMGRTRSALRAYALLDLEPGEVLALTSRKISYFEPEILATAVCAVSDPPYREFRIASSGHPPPVLASPSTGTQLLDLPVGVPLGSPSEAEAQCATFTLEDGALLLFYTDGLIERRGEHLSEGLRRLQELVEPVHPEVLCLRVIHGMFGLDSPPDDVAMVALRRVTA
ncbi:MAG TPA: GAF domain-containing SpoIIE family protein phosphatase [Acidimicrobiales bacterium]|nr:GAF domain-containing SpoIIE family protein phosphatase [Acidimicrobiales bacterium]